MKNDSYQIQKRCHARIEFNIERAPENDRDLGLPSSSDIINLQNMW